MSALKIKKTRTTSATPKKAYPPQTHARTTRTANIPIHAMPLERDAESSRVHVLEEDEEQEDGDEQPQDQRNKRRRTDSARSAVPWISCVDFRFPPGSIIRLAMKNFVTYSDAQFYPGPNMNLVIGPNGSGKSTIVCAICLGLGYRPDVLGRATAVGDYVQHGKEVAEIEIELAQENGQSIVVKRKIKRDKNQSTYYLNGISPNRDVCWLKANKTRLQKSRNSSPVSISKLTTYGNAPHFAYIDVSQFLPQDRVASFAQLSPTQLLHETQRAVGGDEMVAHWERLCALRAEERELQAVSPRTKPVSQSLDLYIGRPKRFQNPGKLEPETSSRKGNRRPPP